MSVHQPTQHDQTRQEAQRLLETAGSVERAGEALESAAHAAEDKQEAPTDRFARQLGFASYLDLFEASTPIASRKGKAWCLTRLPGNGWVVWNDHDLNIAGRCATREEALQNLR